MPRYPALLALAAVALAMPVAPRCARDTWLQ